MEEQEGDINCKHEWVYDNAVVLTCPPTYHKVCRRCGRLEHERGDYSYNDFDEIYQKFHSFHS